MPTPLKTSPNMAYYHPDAVSRINFIRKIQSRHRLPLAAIKGLLKEMDKGRDITPLLELQSQVFGSDSDKMDAHTFCREAGIDAKQLDCYCELGLIVPLESGCFDTQDVEMGRCLGRMEERGMDIKEFDFYPRLAGQIVENEIQMREKYTQDLSFEENAGLTLEMTLMARGFRAYIIDRILQKRLMEFKGLNQ